MTNSTRVPGPQMTGDHSRVVLFPGAIFLSVQLLPGRECSQVAKRVSQNQFYSYIDYHFLFRFL